jgi:hypothetical protein
MAERFLKMKSGSVYRWSPTLAKRKDSMVVDGYAAAAFFRSIGVSNDITEKYAARPIDAPAPEKKRTTTRNRPKAKTEPAIDLATEPELPLEEPASEAAPEVTTGVVITNEEATMDIIGELLQRGTNV